MPSASPTDASVIYLVECFGKIKEYHIHTASFVNAASDMIQECKQISSTRAASSKSVLWALDQIKLVQMIRNFIPDEWFKYLRQMASETDWSIVFCRMSIPCLKIGDTLASFQSNGTEPSARDLLKSIVQDACTELLCYMGTRLIPSKGHSPQIFDRCLLWRNGRSSQLLLSTCFLFVITKQIIKRCCW